ncbi:hypothetical protein DPMN_059481 [Dreissena polymorpha]|uniref:Uncharacterized protein n=1 Tax=Dreissena polymorpha TaxID=45954 RepID=A0A9D4C430_DREPO|nr:hypothetical protein DPMN_059481 [Dreissena polymorpha]
MVWNGTLIMDHILTAQRSRLPPRTVAAESIRSVLKLLRRRRLELPKKCIAILQPPICKRTLRTRSARQWMAFVSWLTRRSTWTTAG